MRRFAQWSGWALLAVGVGLVLLGLAAWPPGGLMFGLASFFLFPGVFLVVLGALQAWLGGRSGSYVPQSDESWC